MDREARHALSRIRRCIAADQVRLTRHFRVRLAERGVLWADVLTVFHDPTDAADDGIDRAGRARWLVSGTAANGTGLTLVCALGRDEKGELVVLVTAYWEDQR